MSTRTRLGSPGLAGVDRERLAELLAGVEPESSDARKLLADLVRDAGLDTVTDGLTDEDEPGPETEPYVETGETWLLGKHLSLAMRPTPWW